jgi:flagellar biosynthetic protein FlhB
MPDRTEQPTIRRRRDARSRGQVARSRDLTWAVLLLAVAASLRWFGADVATDLAGELRSSLSSQPTMRIDAADVSQRAWQVAMMLSRSLLPLFAVALVTSVAINIVQVGFVYAPGAISPTASRVNPFAGLRRFASGEHFARNLLGLLKLITLATVAAAFVWRQVPTWVAARDVASLAVGWGDAFDSLAEQLAWVLLAIAGLDYLHERWRHERSLRMTKQEVRDEQRQQQGDPQVRRQIREAGRAAASRRSTNDREVV